LPTKESTREQRDGESNAGASASAEKSEPAVDIEPLQQIDGHQAELKTIPAVVGDEDTLEGDYGEPQALLASDMCVHALCGTDPPKEDEEDAAKGGGESEVDDAGSTYSERSTTLGPSNRSATRSCTAVRTFDGTASRGY